MTWRIQISLLMLSLVSENSTAEKIYRHAFDNTPVNFDPVSYGDAYANRIVIAVYESLYQYKYLKSPPEIKPLLAEAMPEYSKDRRTLKIKLRKHIFFSDDACFPGGKGREVIAEDFVYSLKRHFDPKNVSFGRSMWAGKIVGLDQWGQNGADYDKPVEGLKALDRYTIQIQLEKPYPQFLHTLAQGQAALLPREAVHYYGKGMATHLVGTGPWKLQSSNASKVVLVKNPQYRRDIFNPIEEGYDPKIHGHTGIADLAGKSIPFIDKIEISFLKQESTMWNSFTKGSEIQIAILPPLQFSKYIKSVDPITLHKPYADQYHVKKENELSTLFFGFNMEDPHIGQSVDPQIDRHHRALRCAIRKAFNWKQFIDSAYYGLGDLFTGVIPPNIRGYSQLPSDESIRVDIDGAKRLLKENGYTAENLPILRYSGVGNVRSMQNFELFKAWMSKIDYPSHKVIFDISSQFGEYTKAMREKKLMTFYIAWYFDFPDAQNGFQIYYGPYASPGSNLANYRNAEFDRLYEKTSVMEDGQERTKIYQRMNEILIEDCAVISGFLRNRMVLWHKNVVIYPTEFSNVNIFRYVALK